jgi:hypothetical protein
MMDTEHLNKIVLAGLRIRPWFIIYGSGSAFAKRFWNLDPNFEVHNPQTLSNKMKWKLTSKWLIINK